MAALLKVSRQSSVAGVIRVVRRAHSGARIPLNGSVDVSSNEAKQAYEYAKNLSDQIESIAQAFQLGGGAAVSSTWFVVSPFIR